MVTAHAAYFGLLGLVALERGLELIVSGRNARRLLAAGGVEVGQGHFRTMVLLHAAFLPACAAEAWLRPAPPAAVAALAGAGVLAAQALRWWAIATLGGRWSTRIIVLPDAPPVTSGPYRFLRHPNYLAVVLEVACLPMAFGAWGTALLFSLSNAALLTVRVQAEERALGGGWAAAFRGRPRFLPGGPTWR
jgi:methyltransferase